MRHQSAWSSRLAVAVGLPWWDDANVAGSPEDRADDQAEARYRPWVAAFLRIYEPLEALPHVRLREQDARAPGRPDRVAPGRRPDLAVRERAAALRAAIAVPPRIVSDLDLLARNATLIEPPGLVLRSPDGVVRVCPADLGARALRALDEWPTRFAPEVVRAIMPTSALTEATAAAVKARLECTPHVKSSAWHIPLSWFVLFAARGRVDGGPVDDEAADDEAVDEGRAEGRAELDAGRSVRSPAATVRYVASMADARRGLARALAAVRRTPTRLLPVPDLEELGKWLEEFHARSVVELDYGGVASLVRHDDDSVDRVIAGVNALRQGDVDVAAGLLIDVHAQWAAVRAYERAS